MFDEIMRQNPYGYFGPRTDEEPIPLQAKIGHSGNSDVDVFTHIEVDTKPIAYAMLCSLYAQRKLSKNEFNLAVKKLEELTNRNKKNSNQTSQKPEELDRQDVSDLFS